MLLLFNLHSYFHNLQGGKILAQIYEGKKIVHLLIKYNETANKHTQLNLNQIKTRKIVDLMSLHGIWHNKLFPHKV